jgi:hypothetical protein
MKTTIIQKLTRLIHPLGGLGGISPIDVKGGKLTFGQRIELGKLYQSQLSEVEKFEQTFQILHGFTPKPRHYKSLITYFNQIIEGITHWIKQETTLLNYQPSAEEKQAGITDFTAKVGEFTTIKAMAKTYGKDPDEILEWEYGKVFGILYTDLEEYKFNQRYNKIIQAKYKT